MARLTIRILLLALLAAGCSRHGAPVPEVADVAPPAPEPRAPDVAETKYLSFQVMTGIPGYSGPLPAQGRFSLSRAQLEAFVRDVSGSIGTTGDARHKLAFAVGPLCFDMSDDETRQFIHERQIPS